MTAAGRAAECGAKVLLLEKNRTLGKKLLLTGGGRCNLTNDIKNVRDFLAHFPQSKEFLYSPFSQFAVQETFDFFRMRGLPLVTEAHDRVFPQTQRAEDVLKTLQRYMTEHNVEIRKGTKVKKFEKIEENLYVHTKEDVYRAKHVIVATGGLAAPETGSTGDGFNFLKELGHTINKPNPNLVPLTSNTRWVHDLSGLTLSFMTIRFKQGGKTHIKKTGKILFTHFGVSGPLILNSSYEVKQLLKKGSVQASIDLFPDTEEHDLDRRVQNLFEKHKNKILKNVLPEMLHKNMAAELLTMFKEDIGEKEIHSITKEERKMLVKKMKDLTFIITGTLGLDKSIVADGGIPLTEVDMKTMSSKKHPNIYLLGDILDINRPSGGFSLQLCWTTGWVAGNAVGNACTSE